MTVASERTHARRSLVAWLSTVLVALTCAAAAAAGAAWVGWRAAGPLPSDARARAIAATLLPGAPVRLGDRDDALFGYSGGRSLAWLLGDDHFTGGHVDVSLGSATSAQVQAAMRASGWRVDSDPDLGVSARKGDVAALLFQQNDAVTVELVRSRPGPVRPVELAGWVAGLLLGWLGAVRVLATRKAAWRIGLASAAVLLPATVLTTGQLFSESVLPPTITPPGLWGDYAAFVVHPMALLGAVLGAAALLVALLPRTTVGPERNETHPADATPRPDETPRPETTAGPDGTPRPETTAGPAS
jgi:hypothetical protein